MTVKYRVCSVITFSWLGYYIFLAMRISRMATYGTLIDLNLWVDYWPTYIDQLEHYFIVNDAKDEDKKRFILLTVCGPSTYQL